MYFVYDKFGKEIDQIKKEKILRMWALLSSYGARFVRRKTSTLNPTWQPGVQKLVRKID
jgi:hypothetical protein